LFLVGDGSYAPLLDVPPGKFSFYYLELALEARLQKKGQLCPWLLPYLAS
jgi:hypothetical protein